MERRDFNNYKEISILIMLIPMLFILVDTLGRINSKINNKNLLETIFNEIFIYREFIVKIIIIMVVIFVISKIKIIKEKFILGDFKIIVGYTLLGVISYKFFGSEYELFKSLDVYLMCIIGMIFILSGVREALSSIDNISVSKEKKKNFEILLHKRVKYLGIMYFVVFSILIGIENLNNIVSSDFIRGFINNYSQHYNNLARFISVLGVFLIIALIIIIKKSFSSLNLCYEEYIYIIKHKTFTEEIKKEINFVNLKVESNKKYINNKFKRLEDKKAQVLLKGVFDLFKDNKR